MVMYCSAPGCKNEHDKRNRLQFHSFPLKRPSILKNWILAVGRENWQPSKSSKLCSAHFIETDYQLRPGAVLRLLKPEAVPSVFGFASGPQRKITCRQKLIRCTHQKQEELYIYPETTPSTAEPPLKRSKKDDTNNLKTDKQISIKIQSPTKKKLQRTMKILKEKMRRRNKKVSYMTQLILQLKKSNNSTDNLNVVIESSFKSYSPEILIQQNKI